jgi:hypothetical protein
MAYGDRAKPTCLLTSDFMTEPTPEALRRYPTTGGFNREAINPDDSRGFACTCAASCPSRCDGSPCGCKACQLQFSVFSDQKGMEVSGEWTEQDRKNALEIYRDTKTQYNFHPTLEGFRRYPDTHGRYAGDPDLPCQCVPSCNPRCDGSPCACIACSMAWLTFCDESGYLGPDGLTVPTEVALSHYMSL